MRDSEYLIVHKSILPPYFEQVIAARELINNQKLIFVMHVKCKVLVVLLTISTKILFSDRQ